jgi:hypothetical protein
MRSYVGFNGPERRHIMETWKYVFVKLSLSLTEHHAMKTLLGNGSIAPHILNLGTVWR